jgi:magnesium chelatase family protein
MRREVEQARQIQLERYRKEEIAYNSQLTPGLIKKYCALDKETKRLLETAFHQLSLSARAHSKIIKVGRTIADLDGCEQIGLKHIAEAIQYRSLDKMYRGI